MPLRHNELIHTKRTHSMTIQAIWWNGSVAEITPLKGDARQYHFIQTTCNNHSWKLTCCMNCGRGVKEEKMREKKDIRLITCRIKQKTNRWCLNLFQNRLLSAYICCNVFNEVPIDWHWKSTARTSFLPFKFHFVFVFFFYFFLCFLRSRNIIL